MRNPAESGGRPNADARQDAIRSARGREADERERRQRQADERRFGNHEPQAEVERM